MIETPPPGIDYARKWWVMLAVAMGIFLATIDGSIVNVALPTLERAFDTNFATVQWVVLAYLLALATLTLAMGRLGDIIGKKPVYTVGFAGFTVGSVLCGLAPTIEMLIVFRVLQAIGAAMVLALGIGILTEAFPPSQRGRALGISGSMVSIGIVIGPTLGGLLIDALGWRSIFFVNLPVGVAGTLTAVHFVPATRPRGRQKFDYPGAGTLLVALLGLTLGLSIGQTRGFADPAILGLFATSAIAGSLFVRIELRSSHPMIDLALFRNVTMSVGLVSGFVTFFAIAGLLILMPFYLENVLGYGPQATGLLLAVSPILLGLAAPVSGALADRVGPRIITVAGLAILVAGYAGTVVLLDTTTSTLVYVLAIAPIGLGMGVFQSPNNSAIMGSVDRTRLGVASGLLSLNRILGQITGIAVLGALWASRTLAGAGAAYTGEATAADPAAQVAGIRDAMMVVVALMALTLVLALWGASQERRTGPARVVAP